MKKIRTFNQIKYLNENHKISICAPLEQNEDISYFQTLSTDYCESVSYHALSNKAFRLIKGLLTGRALSIANFYSKKLQSKFDTLLKEKDFDTVICTSSCNG